MHSPFHSQQNASSIDLLETIHHRTFEYFWSGSHPDTGFARDRLHADGTAISGIASVSGIGFGLLALVVGSERGWITRQDAAGRVALIARSLAKVPRFHGAFPHFVNAADCSVIPFGKRDDGGDLVETTFLLQGAICAREYFCDTNDAETELRSLLDGFIQSVEWSWFANGADDGLFWHWSARYGWARNIRISGWNEALLCYVLAAGAAHHSIRPESYHKGWARNGAMVNGKSYLGITLPLGEPFGGPLFLSQYSFCGLNPFVLQDQYCSYAEQAIAHTRINHAYCRSRYGDTDLWGITSCDGPAGYKAYSPTRDGGIIAPTAALSSFPFLPDAALAALAGFASYKDGKLLGKFGFVDAFSPKTGWIADTHLAIDQGPIVGMMENYRSGLLWRLFMRASEVQRGLERLAFDYVE